MKPEPPDIPLSRTVITDLGFVDIAVEELRPRYMRGCGAIPEDAIDGLNQVVDELRTLVHKTKHSIREELGLNESSQFNEREEKGEEG
jgi:Ni,Fe-hydrogenase III small subunit